MTDEQALLATIAARPDDDLPRLVLADWLDEHGHGDRADFVRVQCELVREYPQHNDHRDIAAERWHRKSDLACPACDLLKRERELFDAAGIDRLLGAERFQWDFWSPVVRRGFAEGLSLPLADFMQFAGEIFTAQPAITAVRLTDREPWAVRCNDGSEGVSWYNGQYGDDPNDAADLPADLFSVLRSTPGGESVADTWIDYPTRDAALSALSAACVAYGRQLAGLPPLRSARTEPITAVARS